MSVTEVPFIGGDRCYDKCNACSHVHQGRVDDYRCPRCSCRDSFVPPTGDAA